MDLPIIDQTSAAKAALKTSHLRHGWSRALKQGEAFWQPLFEQPLRAWERLRCAGAYFPSI